MLRRRRKVARRRRRGVRFSRRRVSFRRRRPARGFRVKLTETTLSEGNTNKNELKPLHVELGNFTEFVKLASNFEYFVPRLVVVTVYPQQNVSNNSTSAMPGYVLFPYHKPIPETNIGFSDFLSVDKAKYIRGTAVGRMAFRPCINTLTNVEYTNPPIVYKGYRNQVWKPKVRCPDNNDQGNPPTLYTGGVVFGGNANIPEGKGYFMIKTDVYLTFYNQNVLQSVQ